MSRGITERQRQVLRFIQDFISKEGFPPTLREIGNNFGMKSTNGVNDHLVALEKKGFIRRRSDISRGIEILHPEHQGAPLKPTQNVPIITKLQNPQQLYGMKNVEKYVGLDTSVFSHRPDFAVQSKDETLSGHGVHKGDIVFVRQDTEAKTGDPVAVLSGESVNLQVLSPNFDGTVLGKVVGFIHSL